jgi:DNA-binding NarL/FixJ family response regulator
MSEIKVLHAENQPLLIEGLKRVLLDYEITQQIYSVSKSELINSGIVAYEPNLLVIDYSQKDFFSISDIEKITNSYPKIAIMVISNDVSIVRITKALELGIKGFLTKNSPVDEVLLAVRKIVKGEKYFCSKIIDVLVNKNNYQKSALNSSNILTDREQEIVKNIASGKTNKQVGYLLGISHHTVHTHRKNVMKKLSIKNSTELALYAVDSGLIELA